MQLRIVDTLPVASEYEVEKFSNLFQKEQNYSRKAVTGEPENIYQNSLVEYYFFLDDVLSKKVNSQKKDYHEHLKMHEVSNLLMIKRKE